MLCRRNALMKYSKPVKKSARPLAFV